MNDTYEDLFSNNNYMNSSYYRITPDINNTTVNSSSDDGFIYDDSFHFKPEPDWIKNNNNDIQNFQEKNLFHEYQQKLNNYIYIYNTNVMLYQKNALILEKYISSLFTLINTAFTKNKNTILDSKLNDYVNNIYRNYDKLLQYIIITYKNFYNKYLLKINEIERYLLITEKKLLQQSWLLIREITSNIYSLPLSDNPGINYYKNYKLILIFKEIKSKLQKLINHIILSFEEQLS